MVGNEHQTTSDPSTNSGSTNSGSTNSGSTSFASSQSRVASGNSIDLPQLVSDVENLKGAVANLESIAADLSKGNYLQLISDVESLQTEIAAVKTLIGDLDKVQIGGESVAEMFATISAWVEKTAGVKL